MFDCAIDLVTEKALRAELRPTIEVDPVATDYCYAQPADPRLPRD